MDLTQDGAGRLGSIRLRLRELREEEAAEDQAGCDCDLDLRPVEDRLPGLLASGALLAVHALAPFADKGARRRRTLSCIVQGPGASLAAAVAVRLHFEHVSAVMHPDEVEVFEALTRGQESPTEVALWRRAEEAPEGAWHHVALHGCDARVPEDLAVMGPLVRRLKPGGLLVLYGLPRGELQATFDRTAHQGLSLRGMGVQGDLGFVSGSPERRDTFR